MDGDTPRPLDRADAAMAAIAAAIGAFLTWWSMPLGARLYPDSLAYLIMAERFEATPWRFFGPGRADVVDELNHWAPLTGMALGALRLTGLDPKSRAELLAVTLGAAMCALMYLVARVRSGRLVAVVTMIALLTSVESLKNLGSLASEGLYVVLTLAVIAALDQATRTTTTINHRWFGVAAALAAIAVTARTIGATLVATVIIVAALQPPSQRFAATRAAIVFGAVPSAVFTVTYGSDRVIGFHPPLSRANQLLRTIASWVLPEDVIDSRPGKLLGAVVALGLLMVIIGWTFSFVWRQLYRARANIDWLLGVPVVAGVTYVAGLGASTTFLDAEIPLNPRILMPLLISVLAVLPRLWTTSVAQSAGPLGRPVPRRLAVGAIGAVLISSSIQSARQHDDYSLSFNHPDFTQSPTLIAAADLPDGTPIVTNSRVALKLLHDRASSNAIWVNGDDDDQRRLAAIVRRLADGGGVIVYTNRDRDRIDLPPLEVLERTPGLRITRRFPDGVMLEAFLPS